MKTLIKNGILVTAADTYASDLLIDGEKIALIGKNLETLVKAETVVDAAGRYVMPGGIDVHTHLSMPFGGTVSCDDFYTGHRGAAFGGTTSHVDFSALSAAARAQGVFTRFKHQGDFLLKLGLLERAGVLGAGKDAATQDQIRSQVNRLAGPDQMGDLFKVLAIGPEQKLWMP